MTGERVQLHALVDLEGRGAERFAGCGRGTNILAAIALDAGVGVEETRPGQVPSLFAPAFRFSDSRSRSCAGKTPEEGLRATRYLAGAAKIWMCLEKGKYISNSSTLPSAPQKPKM